VGADRSPEDASPEKSGEFITLARVVKTQGRHGEVAVEVHSDVPDRFAVGMKLFALLSKKSAQGQKRIAESGVPESKPVMEVERVEVKIDDLWPHKGLLVLKFAGVDSISDAEALIGSELQVPHSDRAELEQSWTYVSDLIGCTVLDHGREIGCIEDVQFGAGEAPLLIVVSADEGGEVTTYDVPYAEAYLHGVNIARKEVRMNLPDGMLEINAPVTAEEKERQASPEKGRKKKH
jgi:16S rRNA processing protein RimM